MNLNAYKLSLIERLLQINDVETLQQIDSSLREVLPQSKSPISDGEMEAFKAGVKDIEAGRVVSWEEADLELYEQHPELAP